MVWIPQTTRMNIRCSHHYSKYNHYFNGGDYDDYCLLGSNAVQFGRREPTFGKARFLELHIHKNIFYAKDECNFSSYMPNQMVSHPKRQ